MTDATPQDIPGMNLQNNYLPAKPLMPEPQSQVEKTIDKTKKQLDKFKTFVTKKYKFVQAIGLLPPQLVPKFIEDEMGDKVAPPEAEKLSKKHHLYVIIPEDKFKEIAKIKEDLVKEIEKEKLDVWLYLKTPVDVWETCLDSKFDLAEAIAMSYPLYDKGFLGALRVAQIHKSLVLQKFEKYVVSYVIGGSIVRDEAVDTSDIDVAVIINDTDVKQMPRLELKERLRSIIYKYIGEAEALAGVKNKLSPQIWLLTDFWEGVKDAQPVYFTFIRDGVPLHDRGTFTPWKALLKMGKLKPSPEAIDMFMTTGDNTIKRAKRALLDIAIQDLFYGVLMPSQGMLMLYGLSPATPRGTVKDMEQVFYTKEKMLEKKYINTLQKIVGIFKDYEHGKVQDISGTQIDKLMKEVEDYIKRLKEVRIEIEKRFQERTIEQIYKDTFSLLKTMLGNKAQDKIILDFEKELVKKGKFTQQHLRILKNIVEAKAEFKKGKLNSQKINDARKDATILINDLIEYTQRKDLANLEKGRMKIKYKDGDKESIAELLNAGGKTFVFAGQKIKKITDKIEESNMEEVNASVEKQKTSDSVVMSPKIFELLKKEFGKFEIIL